MSTTRTVKTAIGAMFFALSGAVFSADKAHFAEGSGYVKSVNAVDSRVSISHNSMPEIGLRTQTSSFHVTSNVPLDGIFEGKKVFFKLNIREDGDYEVVEMNDGSGKGT
ncbi:copper-binding protein [Hahella sp. KA22]|uniref:copper-binding protein n=1 Tax=Hahella sp. KA22 TaxID=1628392 RepID=UPI0013E335E2|nr:copper-binding protein [Hahella sp. KA22]